MICVINKNQRNRNSSGETEQEQEGEERVEIKSLQPEEEFWVHRNLLRLSSRFLQALIKPEWDALREKKHTVVADFEPGLFNAYLGSCPSFSILQWPCRHLTEDKW